MATFAGFSLLDIIVCLSLTISAAMAAMQTMHRDEKKLSAFDVKPGAGRQQFAQVLVSTFGWKNGVEDECYAKMDGYDS